MGFHGLLWRFASEKGDTLLELGLFTQSILDGLLQRHRPAPVPDSPIVVSLVCGVPFGDLARGAVVCINPGS